jgi:hemolysin-activating ACP:hemolysin acyltransferase
VTDDLAATAPNKVFPTSDSYQSLGEIISLMMRSRLFCSQPLGSIAAVLNPAFANGQYVIGRAKNEAGVHTPVAACVWACVSADVDQRLSQHVEGPMRLAPTDWRSGDIPWVIAALGEQLALEPVLRELQKVTLNGRPLKMRARDQDGAAAVCTLTSDSRFPLDRSFDCAIAH